MPGLTSKEAQKRLAEFGPNVLPEKPPPSDLSIFLSQLKNPFVYILIAAAVITVIIGHDSDAVIISIAVVVNTVLGFIQEKRASHALEELKKLVRPNAKVIRDGVQTEIRVEEIVPGDLVVVNSGDKIPADGKFVEVQKLIVTEAILTGESASVKKVVGNKAFMGTIVTSGNGRVLIEVTGEASQMGKIAKRIQTPEEDTPLRKQLKTLSKQLSILVFGLTAFVFAAGVLVGKNILDIFITAVALSVSAIPEGLLVALTVVLAIGMQRILKQKGLVRHLVSAETLGGVTVICVDKTGTLTQGKMQMVRAVGVEKQLALQAVVANDLDDPLVVAAHDWAKGLVGKVDPLVKKYKRLDSIPFNSKNRFFSSLNQWDTKSNMIFVNGAPEFVASWTALSETRRQEIGEVIEKLTSEGKRVLGMAQKRVGKTKKNLVMEDIKNGLEWVGILAFSDPVRKGVRDAFEKTKTAGIKTLVITGDYAETAISVMNQLEIKVNKGNTLLGSELSKMSSEVLEAKIKNNEVELFARTTPDQKFKIVEALKKNGEVVAMMGDGVNDAPALKKADIGIVVGDASDVAKETADLVLLDNDFTTIVEAIEEGRGIFDNIRKIILYLMSDAFEEIIAVIGTIILKFPLPVTAGQILWINLVSDGFPDLALTVDPKSPGIMKKPPRSPNENIVVPWMRDLIAVVSLVGGLMALGLFVYFHQRTGDDSLARSMAFGALGLNSLVYVFSIRTLTQPFWRENPFNNMWLNAAVAFGLVFQLAPYFVIPLRNFLRLEMLSPLQWLAVVSTSVIMFIVIEVIKEIYRWSRH